MVGWRNIKIYIGYTYSHVVNFSEDQSDWTFAATLSDGTTDTALTVTVVSTTQIKLSLTATQTAALTPSAGGTDYDWKLTRSAGVVILPVLAGRAEVVEL